MTSAFNRTFLIAAPLVLCVCAVLAWREYTLAVPGVMVVHFFDVGQGDSALIVTPTGKQVLIDGGPDLSTLRSLGRSMPFFDRSIDLLVLSHPHFDHLAAFPDVLRRYRVGGVLMAGEDYPQDRYQEFLTLLKEQNIPIIVPDPQRDINLGDGVVLDVVWPRPGLFGTKPDNVNNNSVALRARFGSSAVLFTGDMELPEESAILSAGIDVKADVLKSAHHGSKTSSSTGFLLAVDPDQVIVSVGADNTYGHPSPSVVERYKALGLLARFTSVEGGITIRFSR